jgi:hypothetical protein
VPELDSLALLSDKSNRSRLAPRPERADADAASRSRTLIPLQVDGSTCARNLGSSRRFSQSLVADSS